MTHLADVCERAMDAPGYARCSGADSCELARAGGGGGLKLNYEYTGATSSVSRSHIWPKPS